MKIARAVLTPIRLRLRAPLATAHGPMRARTGVLVALHDEGGHVGFGEATPIAGFGAETREHGLAALERLARRAVDGCGSDLDARLDALDHAEAAAPYARFAFETALLDLEAQRRGVTLAALLTPAPEKPREVVAVNALISATEASAVAREALRAVRAGFGTLKLKVARFALEAEVPCVAALRSAVARDVRLRLDANGGWARDEALRALDAFAKFAPELVEQPVPADALDDLAFVRARSPIPIAADESLADAERAARVIETRAADWLVLKPGPIGGLRAGARLADRARDAGIGVFVTSGLDGVVARVAALALAAALPGGMPACGLATGSLLADDLARGSRPTFGALAVPALSGLGVRPLRRTVERRRDGETLEIAGAGS
ncbi:MAG: o-succinylbenzoate synthase [Myxococcota bacterium]